MAKILDEIEDELAEHGNIINEYSKLIEDLECNYQVDDLIIKYFLSELKRDLKLREAICKDLNEEWEYYTNE